MQSHRRISSQVEAGQSVGTARPPATKEPTDVGLGNAFHIGAALVYVLCSWHVALDNIQIRVHFLSKY